MGTAWRARGAPIVAACYVVVGVFWAADAIANGSLWRWIMAVAWNAIAIVWVWQVWGHRHSEQVRRR